MKKNLPSFFIVGAPKCGTTAMASYLNEHENILVSNPKEPHFFATDFPSYRSCTEMDKYLELFESDNEDFMLFGEGSVFYLYSKESIKNVYDFNPNAKIIVMLRNPVDMVYSFHSELIYSADEDILNFEDAWAASQSRKENKFIPPKCREKKLLYYDEIAKYNEQLKRLYKIFPSDQVKVILYDDFKNNLLNVYKETLEFLDIPYKGRTIFSKVNENKVVKNKVINQTITRQPPVVKQVIKNFKKITGIEKIGFAEFIRKNNTEVKKRSELSDEMRIEIYNNYKQDIEKLSITVNFDLKDWKTGVL